MSDDMRGRRTRFPLPDGWTRDALAAAGFQGFVPLLSLRREALPSGRGIYAVLRADPTASPSFSRETRLRAYSVGELEERWVDGAEVVYIGKAESGLCDRLGGFKPIRTNHSGGRSIWQLAEAETLLACWIETPREHSEDVEGDHIDAFARASGRRPFANVAPAAGGTVSSRPTTPKQKRPRARAGRGRGRELVFFELDGPGPGEAASARRSARAARLTVGDRAFGRIRAEGAPRAPADHPS